MNIVKGTTETGFSFEIDRDSLEDMEVIDALADLRNGDGLAVSTLGSKLFGSDQKKRLYDFIRDENGRVPPAKFEKVLSEIFEALGENGKKSYPLPE